MMILALPTLLLLFQGSDGAKTNMNIAFFIASDVEPRQYSATGLVPMGKVAIDEINANATILPDYNLTYTVYDTKGEAGDGIKMLFKFVGSNSSRKDVAIIGPVYSTVSKYIGELAPFFNYVHVSPTASNDELEDQKKYKNSFRMHPVESKIYLPIFEFIKSRCSWTTIHILSSNDASASDDTFGTNILQSFVEKSTAYNYSLQQSSFTYHDTKAKENFANAETAIREMKTRGARVIVANFQRNVAMVVFCAAVREEFWSKNPKEEKAGEKNKEKIVWIIPSSYEDGFINIQNYSELDRDDCNATVVKRVLGSYLVAEFQWNTTSTSKLGTGHKAADIWHKYTEEMKAPRYNGTHREDKAASLMYDAVWLLAIGLQDYLYKTNGKNSTRGQRQDNLAGLMETSGSQSDNLTRCIMKVDPFEGLSGMVGPFDEYKGRRGSLQQLKQYSVYSNPQTQVVCNYTAGTDVILNCSKEKLWGDSYHEKCPLSQSKTPDKKIKGITIESLIICSVVSFMGILLAIFFFIFNLYFIKEKIIRMSSPHINNIILLGSALLYVYVPLTGFMNGISKDSMDNAWQFCAFRVDVWIICIGFTTAFGALFAKTWRVYAIFTSKQPRNLILSDWKLVVLIGILVAVDVILLGINEVVDRYSWRPDELIDQNPTERDLYTDNPEVLQLVECTRTKGSEKHYVLYVVYVLKGLLLLFGVFITVQTRKISIPALNDSKYIGVCIYTVVVVCSIGYPVAIFLSDEPQPSFVVKSGCILFTNTIMLCVIFLPKAYQLKYRPKESIKSQVMRDLNSNTGRRESDSQMKNLQLEVDKRNSVIQVMRASVVNNLGEDQITDIDEKIRALQDNSLVVERAITPVKV